MGVGVRDAVVGICSGVWVIAPTMRIGVGRVVRGEQDASESEITHDNRMTGANLIHFRFMFLFIP